MVQTLASETKMTTRKFHEADGRGRQPAGTTRTVLILLSQSIRDLTTCDIV